jgi:REP element-mobilizing transposase RayT
MQNHVESRGEAFVVMSNLASCSSIQMLHPIGWFKKYNLIPIVKLPIIMKNVPEVHRRRSIRLKGYNYSLPGAYFATLVTQGRKCLFGEISAGVMHTNPLGEMVGVVWRNLPDSFPIHLDEWVIMPNHLHGISWIVDTNEGEATANENFGKSVCTLADALPLQDLNSG